MPTPITYSRPERPHRHHRSGWVLGLAYVVCCFWGVAAQGQSVGPLEVSARRITTRDGLPHQTIYSIEQDSAGWMWIGTPAGLYRYDGVAFVRYGSTRARHAEIHDLQIGDDGAVYAQNFREQLFRVSGDSLEVVMEFPRTGGAFMSYALAGDSLLIARRGAVTRYPTHGGGPGRALRSRPGETIAVVRTSRTGAITHDRQTTPVEHLGPGRLTVDKPWRRSVMQVSRWGDSTYVSMAYNLRRADSIGPSAYLEIYRNAFAGGSPRLVRRLSLPRDVEPQTHSFVASTRDGGYLYATRGGLFRIGSRDTSLAEAERLLGGIYVNTIAFDDEGDLWIGTRSQGIFVLPTLAVRERTAPLPAHLLDLGADADGRLYGLDVNGYSRRLDDADAPLTRDIRQERYWTAGPGRLMFGSRDANEPHAPRSGFMIVKGGARLPGGTIVVASSDQVSALWPPDSIPWPGLARLGFDLEFRGAEGWSGARVSPARGYDVAYDPGARKLWIALSDSLFTIDAGGGRRLVRDASEGLTHVLAADGRGVYAGVYGGRLIHYVGEGGTGGDYLPVDTARGIRGATFERVRVEGEEVWVLTEVALHRCTEDADGLACVALGSGAGLPAGRPDAFAVAGRWVYLAYGDRLVVAPRDLGGLRESLRGVRLGAPEVAGVPKDLTAGEPLRLRAGEDPLLLRPRRASYRQLAGGSTFEYRVVDLDSAWQRVGGERPTIYLPSLPEGRHRLEVAPAGRRQRATALELEAYVPFWRKPWPYVLFVAALSALMVALVRRRALRRQHNAEREAALRESQLAALAAQMNPHFIFNALNSVQDFMLANDRLAANAYLAKFARLIRTALDHSRRPLITVAEEVDAMQNYLDLERIRFDDEIGIDFLVDPDLPPLATLPALLVQPYVENAFKHGLLHREHGRRLRIEYAYAPPALLRVEVRDNGVGRAEAARLADQNRRSSAFSTGAVRRRLALLNHGRASPIGVVVTDLSDGGAPAGTLVELVIPLGGAPVNHDLAAAS